MAKKNCAICGKEFFSSIHRKNICSWECRQERNRQNSREHIRRKRYLGKHWRPCEICGFSETSDIHHEGKSIYILCPNHHALITRGIKTLMQLFEEKKTHN